MAPIIVGPISATMAPTSAPTMTRTVAATYHARPLPTRTAPIGTATSTAPTRAALLVQLLRPLLGCPLVLVQLGPLLYLHHQSKLAGDPLDVVQSQVDHFVTFWYLMYLA
jgi:hypothetical protein